MSLRRPTHDHGAGARGDNVVAFPSPTENAPVTDTPSSDVNPRARRNAAGALLALTAIFWTVAAIVAAYHFF